MDAERPAPRASFDVLVIGDLMVDVVVHHDGPIAVGSDTPSTVHVLGGGSAANTAAWLASLGIRVGLVAAVGEDDVGRSAVRRLAVEGVEVVGPVVAGLRTGTCVVLVGPDGERTMFPDRGANGALTVDDVVAATGFELVIPDDVPESRLPDPDELALIRDVIDPRGLREKEVPNP